MCDIRLQHILYNEAQFIEYLCKINLFKNRIYMYFLIVYDNVQGL